MRSFFNFFLFHFSFCSDRLTPFRTHPRSAMNRHEDERIKTNFGTNQSWIVRVRVCVDWWIRCFSDMITLDSFSLDCSFFFFIKRCPCSLIFVFALSIDLPVDLWFRLLSINLISPFSSSFACRRSLSTVHSYSPVLFRFVSKTLFRTFCIFFLASCSPFWFGNFIFRQYFALISYFGWSFDCIHFRFDFIFIFFLSPLFSCFSWQDHFYGRFDMKKRTKTKIKRQKNKTKMWKDNYIGFLIFNLHSVFYFILFSWMQLRVIAGPVREHWIVTIECIQSSVYQSIESIHSFIRSFIHSFVRSLHLEPTFKSSLIFFLLFFFTFIAFKNSYPQKHAKKCITFSMSYIFCFCFLFCPSLSSFSMHTVICRSDSPLLPFETESRWTVVKISIDTTHSLSIHIVRFSRTSLISSLWFEPSFKKKKTKFVWWTARQLSWQPKSTFQGHPISKTSSLDGKSNR